MSPKIICAAIWYTDFDNQTGLPNNVSKGIVLAGRRHHNCIHTYYKLTGQTTKADDVHIQGFLTTDNRFVDRREGYLIAEAANQILKPSDFPGVLYSEDIY